MTVTPGGLPGRYTDENWVGVVPVPPARTPHVHEFEFTIDTAGDLISVRCPGCDRTWRCEES